MVVQQRRHAVADELGADPVERRDLVRHEPAIMGALSAGRRDPQIRRAPNAAGLYDVLDLILDKGIVVDAFVRVSLVGIELLTVDLRVVIASVDTYLRYAEGVERLQLNERPRAAKLPDMVGGGMKSHGIKKAAESVGRAIKGDDDDEKEGDGNEDEGVVGRLAGGVRRVLKGGVGRIVDRLAGDEDESEDEDAGESDRGRAERPGANGKNERGRSRRRKEHSRNGR